jgi:aldehyde:ferredoxin oxidoreductase
LRPAEIVEPVTKLQRFHLRFENRSEGGTQHAAEGHDAFGHAADPKVDVVKTRSFCGERDSFSKLVHELSALQEGKAFRIGNGAAAVGKAYGITRVPVVKGQAIPAYDPRAIKGIGITYATSTQGADHTMGYTIATNILGVGGTVDPLSKEGQVELSRNLQIATAAIDSTGMCLFIAFAALDDATCLPSLIGMINARFGISLTADDVTNLGKSILKTEHGFNLAAGFTNLDDRLPEFFEEESIAPHNVVWDITGETIDSFWKF